jgi:2-oxoglutarate ferredoxin oxidoreductase subunit gamma
MSNTNRIFCAGFGGQGVMSMGQLLAYAAMLEEKEVTWCPSYGPEMRGGEANCSVTISDEMIGSPLINNDATVCVFMNAAAYNKFKNKLAAGGKMFINSDLINDENPRTDVTYYKIPVNKIATELGKIQLANMVMLGAVNDQAKLVEGEMLLEAFKKVFGASKEKFIPINKEALAKGAEAARNM